MNPKKLSIFLILLASVSACRSTPKAEEKPTAEPEKKAKPITSKPLPPKSTTGPLTPAEKFYGIKITPETKIKTYYPNRQDYTNEPISPDEAISFTPPDTQKDVRKLISPTIPACKYYGDVILLVRWGKLEADVPPTCVNGIRPKYISCSLENADVLHVFYGDETREKIQIYGLGNSILGRGFREEGAVDMVSLIKDDNGAYIFVTRESLWPAEIDKIAPPPADIIINNSSLVVAPVDLPRTFGEMDTFFHKIFSKPSVYCPTSVDINFRRSMANIKCQYTTVGSKSVKPGEPCNEEEDRLLEAKESGFYIKTKEEVEAEEEEQCKKLGCKVINGIRMIDDTGAFKREQEEAQRKAKQKKKQNHQPSPVTHGDNPQDHQEIN